MCYAPGIGVNPGNLDPDSAWKNYDWSGWSSEIARVEQFYYDGARRIQEVVTDPFDPQYVLNKYGFEGLVELVQSGSAVATGKPWRYLLNEYIWGPGDATMGVGGHSDELLVMYDRAWGGSGNALAGRNP